jgi:hypothetical protein
MLKKRPVAAALFALGAATAATAADVDTRIAELERQLAELKAAVASNQAGISANQETIVVARADIEEARPSKAGTRFQYGGFIELDLLASNYKEGKPGNPLIEDFLVGSLIPVEPASGRSQSYQSTNMHAKTSRLYFTTSTDTEAGNIATRMELDFILSGQGDERISNSWSSRMRHAFVNWTYAPGSALLAGQTWTTFFNVGALPDLQDFVGPVGTVFDRQPMIRWTTGGLQLAVENPATRLNRNVDGSLNTAFNGFNEGMPDLVARYNGKVGDLGWSLAGIVRELTYEDRPSSGVQGDNDSLLVYALSLAGKWNLGSDDFRFMFSYGDGLGRYMGLNAFNDGYVNDQSDIKSIDQWGGFIAYRHQWSPHWRSNLSLSASGADNPGTGEFSLAESLAKRYESIHANLQYLPAPNMTIGGELVLARKELEDGRDGDLSRLQFSVKYGF